MSSSSSSNIAEVMVYVGYTSNHAPLVNL